MIVQSYLLIQALPKQRTSKSGTYKAIIPFVKYNIMQNIKMDHLFMVVNHIHTLFLCDDKALLLR